jgi:hypothetical protein
LDKLFPNKRGTSRVWLYALLFWSFVGGTFYLERRIATSAWLFGIQLVLLSLTNIAIGLATSEELFEPSLPLVAQKLLAKSKPSLPWIGWSGFIVGLFCLIWSLAAHWPASTLLPGLTATVAGIVLARPIKPRFRIINALLGVACIGVAVFQLIFGWKLDLAPASVQAVHPSRSSTTPITPAARTEEDRQGSGATDQYSGKSLEDNVQLLLKDIQRDRQLIGNFQDYTFMQPRIVHRHGVANNKVEYGMIRIGPSRQMIRVYYTSDNGRNWTSDALPTDPFFKKIWSDDLCNAQHDRWVESLVRQYGEVKKPE